MADISREDIQAELIRRGALPAPGASSATTVPASANSGPDAFGFMSHPIDNLAKVGRGAQNFVGGAAGSMQRLASTLGEAGQAIGSIAAPLNKYVPKALRVFPQVNIREEMGLAGPNQVDLNQLISHDPNSVMSTLGKYAPALVGGAASIPRTMATTGLWGAIQANPDQTNAAGALPKGRIGAGIEDALLTGATGVAGKELLAGLPNVSKAAAPVINYFRPNKTAKEFLQSLGSGTKEQNVQALAKDIDNAYQTKLQEALAHKRPVYEQEGKSNIYNTPINALPEGNLDKVAYYIAPEQKVTKAQLDKLGEEIKNYRKTNDFDDFTHNVSEIFNADMNAAQVANLEHALSLPVKSDSSFMDLVNKNPKLITGKTQELFNMFNRRKTLNNADKLQSQIGKQMGQYSDRAEKSGLSTGEDLELQQLKEMRDALKNDMQSHLQRVNPKLAEENQTFTNKYRENVIPYQEEKATRAIANEQKYIKDQRAANPSLPYNVTTSQIKDAFSEPSRQALQISGDIGEAGRNKILYNLLADDTNPDARGLANAILQAKQSKGYSQYVTPEIEKMALQLLKRAKARSALNYGAYGLAGAAGIAGAEAGIRKIF